MRLPLRLTYVFSNIRNGTALIFRKHLLLANVGISTGSSVIGDYFEQKYEMLESSETKYDSARSFRMGVTGVATGVLCHHWYIALDRYVPGRNFATAMKKMLLDQLICSPLTITLFFITGAILEKHSPDQFLKEIRCKFWTLYMAEWVVWPPAQLINFLFLPLRYRVLYDSTISFFYDVYTSRVKHDKNVNCE